MHLSAFDQTPISLAEAEVDLTEKYDFDYIKMMTTLCIKIHMKSDSAIESAFPLHTTFFSAQDDEMRRTTISHFSFKRSFHPQSKGDTP